MAAPVTAAPVSESAGIKIDPYYSFNWTEAFTSPSVGDWFVGSNFGTSLGGKYTFNEAQAVLGMCSLQYRGPGLKTQEGREFAERTIDINTMLEDRWTVLPNYTVRTRALFMDEMRRAGSNEVWGHGLYDFWTTGLGIAQDFAVPGDVGMVGDVSYQYFGFPNYTDLLQEFQTGGATAEQSGGLQDYNNIRFRADSRFGKIATAWLGWSIQSYVNAKVVSEDGTYSKKAQLDNVFDVGSALDLTLVPAESGSKGAVKSSPSLGLTFKTSNQNFLRFKTFGDLHPDFIKGYYNYNQVELSAPVRWIYDEADDGGTSSLYLSLDWIFTSYAKRPARNDLGEFGSKKMWTSIFMVTPGIAMPLNRFTHWNIGYTFHIQNSNNKFEKFLPYNFQGHTVFSSVDIAY